LLLSRFALDISKSPAYIHAEIHFQNRGDQPDHARKIVGFLAGHIVAFNNRAHRNAVWPRKPMNKAGPSLMSRERVRFTDRASDLCWKGQDTGKGSSRSGSHGFTGIAHEFFEMRHDLAATDSAK